MTNPVEQAVFVREFLSSLFENHLLSGLISTHEYYQYISVLNDGTYLASVSRRLFVDSPEPVDLGFYGSFRVVYLREPDEGRFPFLQRIVRGDSPRRDLTCFIGHRFLKNIEKSLRFNLVHLLEPHGIHLRWSGYDLSAQDVFEDIVRHTERGPLHLRQPGYPEPAQRLYRDWHRPRLWSSHAGL